MRRRAGMSLLELLIVVSLLGVLLSITATTLIATMHTERQIARDLDRAATLARLAERWRADCHAADSVQVDAACTLKLPDDRVVHYQVKANRIERRIEQEGSVQHRDSFPLPAGAAVKFEAPAENSGRLVRLTIAPGDESAKRLGAFVRTAVIDAAVGIGTPQP